jgi:raffinose/stachyose/melibiose transport system substrate-binding protein
MTQRDLSERALRSALTRRRFTAGALGTAAALAGLHGLRWEALPAAAQDAIAGDIEFWFLAGAGFQADVFKDSVARLEAAYPDVKVSIQELQNDPFKTKLAVAMGSDSPPDVWHTWGGGVLQEYVKAGAVKDLTADLAKDGWGETFAPAALGLMQADGKTWGVPLNVSGVFFYYNTELFEQNGWTPPATWDELTALIGTIKEAGIVPISLANKTKWPGAFYLNYMVERVAGEQFLADIVSGAKTFEDPAFLEACKRTAEFGTMGAFQPGFNGTDYDTGGSRQLLYSGKSAMELMGNWLVPTAAGESPGFEDKLAFFPMPVPPGGVGDPSSLIGGAGRAYAVSEKSKAPAAAVELLRYLTDDTVRDAFAAGGEVPAMSGATIEDPGAKAVAEAIGKARHLQLYWDQFLPPALGQAQLDVSQGLLGGDMTPEQGVAMMVEAFNKASE